MLEKVMSQALNYLSYKPRTEYEMKKYLESKGYPEEIVEKVLDKLKDYKYVNDKEYVSNYHKSQSQSKGYGPLKIQYKLMQKGITKEQYRLIESEEHTDYYFIALTQARKKYKGKNDLDSLRRTYSFLLRRGFTTEVVSKVIATLKEEEY